MANLKRVLWQLLGATRGGPVRIRILQAILERPSNTNQLAVRLGHDYKTIQHHLRVLVENRLLEVRGDRYGATYFPSADLEACRPEFDALVAKVVPSPAPTSPPAPPG